MGFIPAAEFGDPQQTDLTLTVNESCLANGQHSRHDPPYPATLIACISRFFTLPPGDIALTGRQGRGRND
ncbi:fumarylacetoacetate hydrolase family protein [Sodalis sp.]|uniref:fumarylacetoacetate hydrolase family protein n=1 Tax=Sodalis sp. (in: enterobacteria) TaxID=1898979 RepID=UPI003872E058